MMLVPAFGGLFQVLCFIYFFLSGEHFYVSEFFYWHCNCLIFQLEGFTFHIEKLRKQTSNGLVKYKCTLMFKTYLIDLVEIKKIGFQPKSSTR